MIGIYFLLVLTVAVGSLMDGYVKEVNKGRQSHEENIKQLENENRHSRFERRRTRCTSCAR
jgi:hypothetical protein